MLPRVHRFLSIGLALATCSAVCAADSRDAAGWTAVDATGPVHARTAYARSHQWDRVRTGDTLAPLTAVRTGGRGETTLAAGARTLVVGPDSEVELPALVAGDRAAEALQDRGTVDYEIPGAGDSTLDVVTPYLVAAAESATFRVTLASGAAVVDVFEGAVVVTSRLDGASVVVGAGEGASVDTETAAGLALRPAGGEALARRR